MASSGVRTGVQIGLVVVIIGLSYLLYVSLTEPYEKVERQKQRAQETRQRMEHLRTALVYYEREEGFFPGTLDSLRGFLADSLSPAQVDSLLSPAQVDSLDGGQVPPLDSIFLSARLVEDGDRRFTYAVNDTGRVETYLLKDPASDDQIGTLTGDPTQANVASWE
jgi:hypothetical protein